MRTFFHSLLLFSSLLLFGLMGCEDAVEPVAYGRIDAVVVDIRDGRPVENATVTTNPPTLSLITDENGEVFFDNIPVGNYALTVRKSGFKTESLSITVEESSVTQAKVVVTPLDYTNREPNPVSNPSPPDGAEDQPTTLTLAWEPATDPDADTVRYDVYLFESDSLMGDLILADSYDTAVTVDGLRFNTTYYWQVISKDSTNHSTNGPIWSFMTEDYPFNRLFVARMLEDDFELFSADTDGSRPIQLTNNSRLDWNPLPDPRGNSLAFAATVGADLQIFTMTPEGDERFQVTYLPLDGYHNNGRGFTWSPDGGEILYAHYDQMILISRGGFNQRTLATAPANRHWRGMDWTAENGGRIAAVTIGANPYAAEIYLLNEDGTNPTLLIGDEPGALGSPEFSVDGTSLLFTQDASGFESVLADGRQLDSRIYRYDLASGERTDLSEGKEAGTNDLYPRYTPDGAKIVFVNVANDNSGSPSVYIMDADGGNRTLLLENATTPAMR